MNIRRIAALSIIASAALTGAAVADTTATKVAPSQTISVSVQRPAQAVAPASAQLDPKIGAFAKDPIVPGCPTGGILPTIDANSAAANEPLYEFLINWAELPANCHNPS